jgi:hypothetical protein
MIYTLPTGEGSVRDVIDRVLLLAILVAVFLATHLAVLAASATNGVV